jgi:hypothetical protein
VTEFKDPKEIYREALERIPVTVEEHPPLIERAEAWPYPELDRLWVRVETSPFAAYPNLGFTLLGPEGEVVSSMYMIEIRNPYQSLTMHLRRPPLAGQRYRLEILLSRADQSLDQRALDFDLVYRDPGEPKDPK